jgi:hypothetical protein
MAYFDIVYAGWTPNHRGERFNGGERVTIEPRDSRSCGRAVLVSSQVPRMFTSCINANFFVGVDRVPSV